MTIELKTISASIGQRFDGETVNASVSVHLDQITDSEKYNDVIKALIERGLYSVLAECKTSEKPQSVIEFQSLMNGFNAAKLAEIVLATKTRGRAASDYPQSLRLLDAKALIAFQAKALRLNRFIPLPATPSMDLADLVKNKNASVLADLSLNDVFDIWRKVINGDIESDHSVINAMSRILDYIKDCGNKTI